jgi:hypothetical protein
MRIEQRKGELSKPIANPYSNNYNTLIMVVIMNTKQLQYQLNNTEHELETLTKTIKSRRKRPSRFVISRETERFTELTKRKKSLVESIGKNSSMAA